MRDNDNGQWRDNMVHAAGAAEWLRRQCMDNVDHWWATGKRQQHAHVARMSICATTITRRTVYDGRAVPYAHWRRQR